MVVKDMLPLAIAYHTKHFKKFYREWEEENFILGSKLAAEPNLIDQRVRSIYDKVGNKQIERLP